MNRKSAQKRKRIAPGSQADLGSPYQIDKSPPHPILKSYFGYCMHKVSGQLRARFAEALSTHAVIPPHFGILTLLKASEHMSQLEIGLQLGIDKATMVKLIDDLESHQFVTRSVSPEDRRVKLVRITPRGVKSLEKFAEVRQTVEEEFLAPLSAEERRQLKHIVSKLLAP